MNCPCMDCPYRKLTCHDHCEEYTDWHDEVLAAKLALHKADDALDMILAHQRKRRDRWFKGGNKRV